eukprot:3886478-Ditylum_brightwellii.AAC.1
MCKDHGLGVMKLAIKEDWEVGASLLLSKKPASSQEITCKDDCLEVKELAIKEVGEVGASLLLGKKPVSSQEI